MLPQMLDPILGNEGVDVPRRVGRIGKMLPEQRAVATVNLTEPLQSLRESGTSRWFDVVFYQDHDRPSFGGYLACHLRIWPVQRRTSIHGVPAQSPAKGEHACRGQRQASRVSRSGQPKRPRRDYPLNTI